MYDSTTPNAAVEARKAEKEEKKDKKMQEALAQLKGVFGSPKAQKKAEKAAKEAAAAAAEVETPCEGDLASLLGLEADMAKLEAIVKNPMTKKLLKLFVSAVGVKDDDDDDEQSELEDKVKDLKEDILNDVEEAFENLKAKIEERIAGFEDSL
jgi:hypothetical protein